MNDYEKACERFEQISRNYDAITKTAKAVIQWADDEYAAAQDNLRQYESKPGIPLPQYREREWSPALDRAMFGLSVPVPPPAGAPEGEAA